MKKKEFMLVIVDNPNIPDRDKMEAVQFILKHPNDYKDIESPHAVCAHLIKQGNFNLWFDIGKYIEMEKMEVM